MFPNIERKVRLMMLTLRRIRAEITRIQRLYTDMKGNLNYTRKVQDNDIYLDKELKYLFESFNKQYGLRFIIDSFDDDASATILMTFILDGELERISISIP